MVPLTTATCASQSRIHHDPSVPTHDVGPDADIIYIVEVPGVPVVYSVKPSLDALVDLRRGDVWLDMSLLPR